MAIKNQIFYLIFVIIISITAFSYAEITIIANKSVKQDTITKKEVKKVFQGRQKTWDDGSNIIVTILKDDTIFRKFLKSYVKTNPTQFKNVWRRLIFTGKVTSDQIQIFSTEEDVLSYITKTKGAIGYTAIENIPGGLKIIQIGE